MFALKLADSFNMKTVRLPLADILKGVAVLRMILVHVVEVFALSAISDSLFTKLALFLAGPPGAALFMLIMGYFIAKSSKSSVVLFFRGSKLLFWGLLLNIGMNAHLLFLIATGNLALNPWPYILGVDIFFLAGFSMMLLSMVRRYFRQRIFLISFLFLLITLLGDKLPIYQGEYVWFIYLQAFFYGGHSWAYFPVFPWAAYPVAGYLFHILDQRYGLTAFTRKGLIYASVALFVFVAISFSPGFKVVLYLPDYYHHGLFFALWLINVVLLWILLIHLFTFQKTSQTVFSWLQWIGQRVTIFYVIQWLLIGNIGTAIYKTQSAWNVFLWFLLIVLLTAVLTYAWQKIKLFYKQLLFS